MINLRFMWCTLVGTLILMSVVFQGNASLFTTRPARSAILFELYSKLQVVALGIRFIHLTFKISCVNSTHSSLTCFPFYPSIIFSWITRCFSCSGKTYKQTNNNGGIGKYETRDIKNVKNDVRMEKL